MIESMTGFGRGVATAEGLRATAEVRSVNGRYIEVAVRAPRELGAHELDIQHLVRAGLGRGKVQVSLHVERTAGQAPVTIDEPVVRGYAALLQRLRAAAGIEQAVQLEHLLQLKEVFVPAEVAGDDAALWSACRQALEQALAACRSMRAREGAALAEDLRRRLGAIEQELAAIEAAAPRRVAAARENLRARVAELLEGDARVDAERLELEITLLADRLDITEECVRLRAHLEQFRAALEEPGQPGRRLNFLAQELHREINTIASKANDAAIAHRAVRMKEELEKIREQVQNVV